MIHIIFLSKVICKEVFFSGNNDIFIKIGIASLHDTKRPMDSYCIHAMTSNPFNISFHGLDIRVIL